MMARRGDIHKQENSHDFNSDNSLDTITPPVSISISISILSATLSRNKSHLLVISFQISFAVCVVSR
jgi:hypothetical protein